MRPGFNLVIALALALTAAVTAHAKAVFTAINGPQGGRVLMTPLNASSEQAALVALLRDMHQYFGAKPEIGEILKDTSGSVSALFSDVTEGKQVQGIAIVSDGSGDTARGTVVYDLAPRFGKTANTLLKIAQEHTPAAAEVGAAAMGASDPPAPLTRTTFPDGSGSIGLPAGWRIAVAYQGGAIIVGPKHERLILGNYFSIIDPGTPQGHRQVQMAQTSGRGLPGKYTAQPYTTNAAEAYITLARGLAEKQGNPEPSIQVNSSKSRSSNGNGTVTTLTGMLDFHDGEGQKNFVMQVWISQPMATGDWAIMTSGAQVPVEIGTRERDTLNAMAASYRADYGVVDSETQRAIDRIHASGEAVRREADAAHAQEDAGSQDFDQHMSDIDRQGSGFSDYLLDQSVVSNDQGEHKRFYNDYANALVQLNPQKFSIVPTSQYIQGEDF